MPKAEDLFSTLAGGISFTKLDLSHAYQQIVLDEAARELVTVNTHRGLYRYTRLPFGVSSAPSLFQRTMENLFKGFPNVCVYIDDILLTGKTEEEHLKTLEAVLDKLSKVGMKLKKEKCMFFAPEVIYLGHRISRHGIQPTEGKVRAIVRPASVTQLKAFLGLLNYYCKFLPNLATVLVPMYDLLKKGSKWNWGKAQEAAFQKAKSLLQSPRLLVHYNGEDDNQ